MNWQDTYRACQDGSSHFGELELITWEGDNGLERMGWGNVILPESKDFKRKYEEEFGRDDKKLYQHWPQAYRWTCCGTSGAMNWGCDHHGTGPKPCSCDFCHMGKPLPDKIYREDNMERKRLKLSRGPDPRSYNPIKAATADFARSLMGM